MSMPEIGVGWGEFQLPEMSEGERSALDEFLRTGNIVEPPPPDEPPGETEWERRLRLEREARQREMMELRESRQQSARGILGKLLTEYGLSELIPYVFDEIIANERVDIRNPDAIMFAIRDQNAYKQRFAANSKRVAAGLAELDPATYIQMEEQYRTVMRSNGLPTGFYDQTSDFEELLAGDVSPSELQSRVEEGFRAVDDADPEVLAQLQRFYPEVGSNRQQLAAYFLDPSRAAPLLTRQARAAQIAARGRQQAGIQLTGELAEDLARRGVTQQEAERGFGEIGALGELRQQFAGEEAISEQELVQQQFGVDIAARERLRRRQQGRVAAFEGGGSFSATTGATSFARETGAGRAQ